jgi:hypothetical protein
MTQLQEFAGQHGTDISGSPGYQDVQASSSVVHLEFGQAPPL